MTLSNPRPTILCMHYQFHIIQLHWKMVIVSLYEKMQFLSIYGSLSSLHMLHVLNKQFIVGFRSTPTHPPHWIAPSVINRLGSFLEQTPIPISCLVYFAWIPGLLQPEWQLFGLISHMTSFWLKKPGWFTWNVASRKLICALTNEPLYCDHNITCSSCIIA